MKDTPYARRRYPALVAWWERLYREAAEYKAKGGQGERLDPYREDALHDIAILEERAYTAEIERDHLLRQARRLARGLKRAA